MNRKTFDRLVGALDGDGVLFETSYGSFYLYTYDDGTFSLGLSYKYACGLDENLAPIYQYTDDDIWSVNFISMDKLYRFVNKILAGDPYGTYYSKHNANKNIKG